MLLFTVEKGLLARPYVLKHWKVPVYKGFKDSAINLLSTALVIFISIFLGSSSCDFQWSDRAIYIHEFG
jgi:hypothetical protein